MKAANGILLIGNFLANTNGNQAVGEDLAFQLSNDGWDVLTVSGWRPKLIRLSDMVYAVWKFRNKYAIAHVDVFSGPAFIWAEAVCLALRRVGKPYILTLRGGNLPEFSKIHRGRVQRLLKSAAAVTAPSNYLAESMKPFREDIILLPNPIHIRNYPFRLRKRATPRLIWLRAFHEIYNPSLAIHTLARLKEKHPDARLTMVGPDKKDGSLEAALRLARQYGVLERVRFTGGVPKTEVPDWLGQADIFLNTANIDNTPVSVIEALACGLCVVSTSVGGIPYLLEDEHNALLVPPDDPNRMAEAADRLLSDNNLAEHLSFNARKKAEQFAWTKVLPRWLELLETVLERYGIG